MTFSTSNISQKGDVSSLFTCKGASCNKVEYITQVTLLLLKYFIKPFPVSLKCFTKINSNCIILN